MKSILKLTAIFLFFLTTPILAQTDPGDDPDVPAASIDSYVWVLILIGAVYVFLKMKAYGKQAKMESRWKKTQQM